jgi:hypothetical protein
MAHLIRFVGQLPLAKSTKLEWQARMVDRAYKKDIAKARASKDREAVRELQDQHREELAMMREESDDHLSAQLIRTARRLRVPVPPLMDEEHELTVDWERGSRLGMVYLSDRGIAKVREAIRAEQRWRQEHRAHWVLWLSAATGIIGALTGLLAILGDRIP